MTSTINYREAWQEQGYLVLRGAFDKERIARLYELCEDAFSQWRENSREYNQPFGYCYGPTAWVMLHLNHPMYHRQHPERLPTLLDAIADPLVLEVLRDVFQDEGVMMQANYYIDPSGETRIGNWHRDCQFYPGADEEGIKQRMMDEADPPRELHMHIPLVPTAASEVVPGSHNRWDTEEENHIRLHDAQTDAMPNALKLHLEPGDLAFFHVNALHRGNYFQGVLRRTIAVTYGRASYPRFADAEMMKSWRGYVASYQPWFLEPNYLDGVQPATRAFFEHFIELYKHSWKPEYLEPLNPEMQEYFMQTRLPEVVR